MAAYQLTSGSSVTREADGANIPATMQNVDWQGYQAWLAAGNTPDPAPTGPVNTDLSPRNFMARFTTAESAAIATAAQTNASVLTFMLQVSAADYINVTDPRTIAGVNALVTAGLLTSSRAPVILALPTAAGT